MSCRLKLRHQVLSDAELILHAPRDDQSYHSRVRHAAGGWPFISLSQVIKSWTTWLVCRAFVYSCGHSQSVNITFIQCFSRHIHATSTVIEDRVQEVRADDEMRIFDAHTISYRISSHRIWKHCNAACEEGAKAYEPCSMGWVSWVGARCFHATYSEMIGNGLGRWDSHGSIDSSTLLICTCTRLQGKFRYHTVPRVYRS